MRILVTCPPMLALQDEFVPDLERRGLEVHCPEVVQTLTEEELIRLLPNYEGWIIGDDPASREVVAAGKSGRLMAAVKWGVGTDNVDFDAFSEFEIPIVNTPNMFGHEVADIAMGYLVGLARQTFLVDRRVREGIWFKPQGMSLAGRTVGIVGLGDIGQQLVKRVHASGMDVVGYDPAITDDYQGVKLAQWPSSVGLCDFIVFCCALNSATKNMLNHEVLSQCRPGVRIVNVARGGLVDQEALIENLRKGHVHSAALDVFESEPLSTNNELLTFENCILGSHNSSNTLDAARRTTSLAIEKLVSAIL